MRCKSPESRQSAKNKVPAQTKNPTVRADRKKHPPTRIKIGKKRAKNAAAKVAIVWSESS